MVFGDELFGISPLSPSSMNHATQPVNAAATRDPMSQTSAITIETTTIILRLIRSRKLTASDLKFANKDNMVYIYWGLLRPVDSYQATV